MSVAYYAMILALVSGPLLAEAGDIRFEPCAQPRAFAAGCPALEPEPGTATAAPSEPLFTKETVSSTTPPLLLQLANDPTEANADALLTWQAQRWQRLQEVEALLQRRRQARGQP